MPLACSQPPLCPADPAELNGDLPLSRELNDAYMEHHAGRNAINARRSLESGVRTRNSPVWGVSNVSGCSPARALLDAFFARFARQVAPAFRGRPVTIVDLGAGGGARLRTFALAGLRGDYIGIDIARNPKWPREAVQGLRPSLIVADLHGFDERTLPPIDLLISSTALEHVRDDEGIIRRFARRLAPGGVQAHFVPGEAALDLYGRHGWRQYSPACLRRMFPEGTIYRLGGRFSNALHLCAIYEPARLGQRLMGERHPRLYRWLRSGALVLDRVLGCQSPSMYGVVTAPTAEWSVDQRDEVDPRCEVGAVHPRAMALAAQRAA